MEFFCYHRDRSGSTPLRSRMVEEHWAYMDRFAATMIARGPTFTSDGTLTGSVHILDLPDPAAARAFAFEEPGYQAGAYRDVLLRRWRNALGRTMWDFTGSREDDRYLVLGFTEPTTDAVAPPLGDELVASGPLLSDDGRVVLGAAVLLEAPHADPRARSSPMTGTSASRCTSGSSVGGRLSPHVRRWKAVEPLGWWWVSPGWVVGAVVVERAEELAVGEVGAAAGGPGLLPVVGLAPGGGDAAPVGGAFAVADGHRLALGR